MTLLTREQDDAGEGDRAQRGGGDVQVITLGCRLNAYESDTIRAQAVADGVRDAVVVNTCAVTAEAVRQARQAIRKARRERPGAKIVATGCAAQIDPAAFAAMPQVDLVLGNDEKARPGALLATERVTVGDIFEAHPPLTSPLPKSSLDERATEGPKSRRVPEAVDDLEAHASPSVALSPRAGRGEVRGLAATPTPRRARAYVQVQNGCDHRCTFCVIPFGRGNSRSTPADRVVAEVRQLARAGYAEVVLTGVDLTSWGAELSGAPPLGRLVATILAEVPELARLRLSSIDAAEIDAELMASLASEPRLAPHLHLSLQSGDDLILKRMKRRHSRQQALDLIAAVRAARPEVAFGADLIAGFPTESDDAFENTLAFVEEAGLAFVHVFPFSPRPGTPAARMPQVPSRVVKGRAARLRAAAEAALARHLDRQVGRRIAALVERTGRARAGDFTEIAFEGEAPIGALTEMRLTAHDGRRAAAALA